jgi:2-polyprenyl-3-methyl-5-hydroxy-6-metoxy-1,4-benzoquinol methylase
MNNEDLTTINYYSNKNISNFYKDIWGGENIHIGIYDDENLNLIDIELIKRCSNRKSILIYRLINMYSSNSNIHIGDFGSGFGGTARMICKNRVNVNIDCYDISKENCIINMTKNLKENVNISIYNLSFFNIPTNKNYYDIIISEDVFIHINNKNKLFEEMYRVLKPYGFIIISDIILTDKANKEDIKEVYERIGINNIDSEKSYKKIGEQNGFILCNSIEYQENMLIHYESIKKLTENKLEKTEDYNKIINGLNNWIKHIKLNNITWNILIFKKVEVFNK